MAIRDYHGDSYEVFVYFDDALWTGQDVDRLSALLVDPRFEGIVLIDARVPRGVMLELRNRTVERVRFDSCTFEDGWEIITTGFGVVEFEKCIMPLTMPNVPVAWIGPFTEEQIDAFVAYLQRKPRNRVRIMEMEANPDDVVITLSRAGRDVDLRFEVEEYSFLDKAARAAWIDILRG